jgi:hypothetical protein
MQGILIFLIVLIPIALVAAIVWLVLLRFNDDAAKDSYSRWEQRKIAHGADAKNLTEFEEWRSIRIRRIILWFFIWIPVLIVLIISLRSCRWVPGEEPFFRLGAGFATPTLDAAASVTPTPRPRGTTAQ